MKVENGRRVKMSYELWAVGNGLIESSAERGPVDYIHGSGQMLPGLEKQIEGMDVGAEREGVIPAREAYGTVDMLPTKLVPKKDFGGDTPTIGKQFEAKQVEGGAVKFTVVEDKGQDVLVRFDHPLAGRDIRYKVKILGVSG